MIKIRCIDRMYDYLMDPRRRNLNRVDFVVERNHFPDGTLKLAIPDELILKEKNINILWLFEENEEMIALYFVTRQLQESGIYPSLTMPYIPNARQDRIKSSDEVFTLKHFAQIINDLHFSTVTVFDPHSAVSEALFDNLRIIRPDTQIKDVLMKVGTENLLMFYPDEGAMKRYSGTMQLEYLFGIKNRDWYTGEIKGFDLFGDTSKIKGKKFLMIDDICCRGGTFYHSAKKLEEYGAKEIYIYVSHCENTILEGQLLDLDIVKKIYTTDSVFRGTHKKIEIIKNW